MQIYLYVQFIAMDPSQHAQQPFISQTLHDYMLRKFDDIW